MHLLLELAAQSNPCSFSVDFQPTPHVLRWKGGRSYLFLGEWRSIFFAQQVFTSLVPKPSIKTDFVHWHCSLPFRVFANLQETRLQPILSFALLSSHPLQAQGKTTTSCVCLSAWLQQASGAFKRERGRAVKDRARLIASELRDSARAIFRWAISKETLSLAFLRQNCPSTGPFVAIIHAKQKWNRQKHLTSTFWRKHGAAWTFASTVPPAYGGHLSIAHNAHNV